VPPDGDTNALALSRDGRILYFESIPPGSDRGAQSFSRIYAVPTDGSAAPRVLAESSGTALGSPALSPDGSRLAYLAVSAPVYTPGRAALMMMDLKSPLKQGDKMPVTLEFEKAGKVAVTLDVQGVGAQGPAASGASEMKMKKM